MWRLSRQFKPFLQAVERVRFVDLLLAAAFGIPTWLLAAAGGLAMVYFAAGDRRDWSTTALLLAALAAGAVVAAITAALIFIWTVLRELFGQLRRRESDIAIPEVAPPEASSADDGHTPVQGKAEPEPEAEPEPVARPAQTPRKIQFAPELLEGHLGALAELSRQLDGPIQDAYDFGNAMSRQIAEACRTSSKQEIIDRLELFKSFTEAALKNLAATVRKYPAQEIADLGPWDYVHVIDKTGVLGLLIPLVPDHILREANFSTPALRQAGAEWVSAVNGFGVWIAERKQKIAAIGAEYESAAVSK